MKVTIFYKDMKKDKHIELPDDTEHGVVIYVVSRQFDEDKEEIGGVGWGAEFVDAGTVFGRKYGLNSES